VTLLFADQIHRPTGCRANGPGFLVHGSRYPCDPCVSEVETTTDLPEPEPSCYGMNRAALMEWLYHLDGRQEPSHPLHSLYTGLADKYRHEFGSVVLESLARTWHEGGSRGVLICAEGAA
jgi:hypothetical protein